MTKTHFILRPEISSIVVNGHDLSNVTHSVRLSMVAGSMPEIELQVFASKCEVDADGIVRLDDSCLPDELAQDFFETLKKRFDSATSAPPRETK